MESSNLMSSLASRSEGTQTLRMAQFEHCIVPGTCPRPPTRGRLIGAWSGVTIEIGTVNAGVPACGTWCVAVMGFVSCKCRVEGASRSASHGREATRHRNMHDEPDETLSNTA